jgi:hypothetical protein
MIGVDIFPKSLTINLMIDAEDPSTPELRDVREQLELILNRLDNVGADVAALHIDAAIVELFRLCGDDAGDRSVPWPETVQRH